MICQHCKRSRLTQNAFEDGIYSILIAWLNSVTCINWYRYYPEYRRPDGELEDEIRDEQYGMLFIPRYRPVLATNSPEVERVEINQGGETEYGYCLNINETEEFDLDLYVYREGGEKVRTDQSGENQTGLSASDVLKQVNILIPAKEFNESLSTAGIKLNRTANIDVIVEKRESIWEWQAAASFTGQICRQVSFPVSGEKLIYCVETCDGKPVCIQKQCEE